MTNWTPCTQCGRCCLHWGGSGLGSISQREYKRLPDKAKRYCYKIGRFYDIWVHPEEDEELTRCPFVRKLPNQERYKCTIYNERPDVCRIFPVSVEHASIVSCDMIPANESSRNQQP